MTIVKLNKNRDLLDPNFSGYKLSLDSVAVTSTDLPQAGQNFLRTEYGSKNRIFLAEIYLNLAI